MAAAYQCHFNQFSSKFHIPIASIKLLFNTFDNFTKAFIKKSMHLNINYIVSVPPFCNVWYHVVLNVTPRRRTTFPVKVTKIPISCSPLPGMKSIMLMQTTICILIPICITTQHSEPRNKSPDILSIYSIHAHWNKGEHEKKLLVVVWT